jgi:hypothetical protein
MALRKVTSGSDTSGAACGVILHPTKDCSNEVQVEMTWKGILMASLAMWMGVPLLAQHEHHPGSTAESPTLFQSDMSVMAGMTLTDAGSAEAAGWHVMDLGIARIAFNRQGRRVRRERARVDRLEHGARRRPDGLGPPDAHADEFP